MHAGAAAGDCVTSGVGAALGATLVLGRAVCARVAAFTVETWAATAILAGAGLLALQLWLVAVRLAATEAAGAAGVAAGAAGAHAAAASWAATLVPLWLIDGALALALVVYLMFAEPASGADEDADELRYARIKAFCALVLLAMFFASEVMLVDKLDGRRGGPGQAGAAASWHAVLAPLYAATGVLACFGSYYFYHNLPGDDEGGPGASFIV